MKTKKAIDKQIANILAALTSCRLDAKAKGFGIGNGGIGEIECPACKGRLKYSVAGYNGHLWGACATEGCLRWME